MEKAKVSNRQIVDEILKLPKFHFLVIQIFCTPPVYVHVENVMTTFFTSIWWKNVSAPYGNGTYKVFFIIFSDKMILRNKCGDSNGLFGPC